jgi:SAM-dependent methyltransferase
MAYVVEQDHRKIAWGHSIELENGVITQGCKTAEFCDAQFNELHLTAEMLRGKRVLDVGCNDGYMSLRCEKLGVDVVGIDGIYWDGLKFIRAHLKPKFKFYCMDLMSPTFLELGRFDVIIYFGVLYHTVYPFEQLLRLTGACNTNAILFLESEYYDLAGFEREPTLIFNYEGKIVPDLSTPLIPFVLDFDQNVRPRYSNIFPLFVVHVLGAGNDIHAGASASNCLILGYNERSH